MDRSLDEWSADYLRLSDALNFYCHRIATKAEAETPPTLGEPERVFEDLMYYWCAALENNNDVFSYVPFIIEHKSDFAAIGADGTLKALAMLLPFYEAQDKLKDEVEKGEYWWRTKEERKPAEDHAEGLFEFARLLLSYAKKNLGEEPV